jgi:hypothetical protein
MLSTLWKTLYKIVGAAVVIVTFFQPLVIKRVEKLLGAFESPIAVTERFEDLRRYGAEFENRSEDRTLENITVRVDLLGVAGTVALLKQGRVVERLESADGGQVASSITTLNPGEQITCEVEARGSASFGTPPRVSVYARDMRIGTPADAKERIARANARTQEVHDLVWSVILGSAGLFCLASLGVVIWFDRRLHRKELELQDERRVRLALTGSRPSGV